MLLFITINYTLSSAILQVYFTIFFSSSMQKNKIYAMCKFLGFRSYWSDQGASPLEPDRQGAGAEYLRSGKGETPFPPGGRLYCGQAGEYLSGTPLRSATASAFLPTPGTPCACCRRRSRAERPDADRVIDRYPDGG